MSNKYYITAAIPYVNGKPHIGHALEFVQADVLARYQKMLGKEVTYLCGSDENGLKMVQAAEKENISVQELCDQNAQKFKDLFIQLNTTLDIFEQASSETHKTGSQKLWELCDKNGDIYKKTYKGLYCVGCETFYTPKDLVDGKCPEHLTEPEKIEEENYFFKLSKYQDQLLELIETDKLKIVPAIRKNEIISFIKQGLEDFSISRSRERAHGWGIPVPNDETQIIYIWFDALNIYQTGIGFGHNDKQYQYWWPADNHVIGKGIIRFHAAYWPAILLSAQLPLPKRVTVHGYINSNGQKMSKSIGNVIDPFEELNKYKTDAVRYYLLSQIPPFQDGDYNEEQFIKVYNSDLANGIGNLVARVAKLCEKSGLRFESSKTEFKDLASEKEFHQALEESKFNEALAIIWDIIRTIDKQIDTDKPWEKLKKPAEELQPMLQGYIEEIRKIAVLLEPFMPKTSQKINYQYKGNTIHSTPPLFPRIG